MWFSIPSLDDGRSWKDNVQFVDEASGSFSLSEVMLCIHLVAENLTLKTFWKQFIFVQVMISYNIFLRHFETQYIQQHYWVLISYIIPKNNYCNCLKFVMVLSLCLLLQYLVIANGYVVNRQLINTSLKYILTVVQLFVTIVDLCCMDFSTKGFDVAVCVIHLCLLN